MIRKFKVFTRLIPELEKWLNKMSDRGYRLIKTGNTFYYFEECEKGKYVYAVDYVANKSYPELMDYEDFLKESNIRCIEKSASIGKVTKGNIRWRPYADKGARIATSKGMIRKEFLILEKESDGSAFDIYTNIEDKINALKIMRKPTITMILFVGLMILISNTDVIPQYQWSLFKLDLFPKVSRPLSLITLGFAELLLFINLIKFTLEIKRLKKDGEMCE